MKRKGRGAVIAVVLALLLSATGFHLVSAQDAALDLDIVEVDDEGEYIVIENEGEQSYGLSGLTVSFGDDYERFSFPDGTTIGPGESITVGTGSETNIDADYNAGYDGTILYNGEPDIVELRDGNAIVTLTLGSVDDSEQGATAPGDDESSDSDDSDTTDEPDSSDEDTSDSSDDNAGDNSDDSNDSDDSDDSDGDTGDSNDSEETTTDESNDKGDESDDGDSDESTTAPEDDEGEDADDSNDSEEDTSEDSKSKDEEMTENEETNDC
ncbi:lamin tail domain-containing protein [Haladaptatus sp. DFWS20]|uniref:lamin tail domain-containing protein n=1 Tax=Haladaptatus sp. DFWS20 TaxID=3403467 RepID=UPI003EBE1181